MFRKILVPLDRSSLAERVLEDLRWLAHAETTELALISVVEPAHYFPYIYRSGAGIQTEKSQAIHYVHRYLEGRCSHLRNFGYAVSMHVVEGDPADRILALAKEWPADLIAMTTHGRSGFTGWALGSVAERVIHGAAVPILLVREQTPILEWQHRRILVPLDGSDLAIQALSHGIEVATSIGASLLLLRVLDIRDSEGLGVYFEDAVAVAETMAEWRDEAETYLEEVAQSVHSSGLVVETRVLVGVPDKVICEVVTDESINLIVMSTHGRSGFRRWVYGSTANNVLRTVSCPLVLVRADRAKRGEPLVQLEEAHNTRSIQTSNSSPAG